MTILHTCLNVTEADRTADWYVDELGFERSWEFTTADDETRNVYIADENGVEIQLSDTVGHEPSEQGNQYDHIAVKVDEVDAAFERIENHGVVKEPGDQPEADARTAFIKDPDGHHVELIEPL